MDPIASVGDPPPYEQCTPLNIRREVPDKTSGLPTEVQATLVAWPSNEHWHSQSCHQQRQVLSLIQHSRASWFDRATPTTTAGGLRGARIPTPCRCVHEASELLQYPSTEHRRRRLAQKQLRESATTRHHRAKSKIDSSTQRSFHEQHSLTPSNSGSLKASVTCHTLRTLSIPAENTCSPVELNLTEVIPRTCSRRMRISSPLVCHKNKRQNKKQNVNVCFHSRIVNVGA